MIDDFTSLDNGTVLETDVCIIGAGAAGLLIARELAQSGVHVVLVESGGWSACEEISTLSEGQAEAGSFRGLRAGRSRVFGGTTSLWGGQCIRLDPIDFERRDWVPYSGWPISSACIAPYYAAAEAVFEIADDDAQRPAWDRFGVAPVAFDPTRIRPVHGVFIRQPDLGRRFRAEIRAASRLRVLLNATVQKLTATPNGKRIKDVEIGNLQGRRARVRARRVVLCAGAIENARLLLLSDDVQPAGLGNQYDQVGRYLQDHPCGCTARVYTKTPRLIQDHWNMLYGKGTRYLPKIALAEAAQRHHHLLNCVGRLAYDYDETTGTKSLLDLVADIKQRRRPRPLAARLARIGRGLPDIAESIWRVRMRGLSPAPRPRAIHLELFSEQTPDPQSRITLDAARDAFGLRQVRVEWHLDALTGRTLAQFTHIVGEEFARLGLGRLQSAAWLDDTIPAKSSIVDSFHPAGTTRMAHAPREGVVDINSQVFGVDGLYVAGSSVFPTSGAANPTLTIAAMALRLAGHLRALCASESAHAPPRAKRPSLVEPG